MAKMPRTKSVSAWASFLKEEDLSIPDAVKRTTSFEMQEWLRDNSDEIMELVAENEKETAVATFETEAEFVEEVEDDEAKPSVGVRI